MPRSCGAKRVARFRAAMFREYGGPGADWLCNVIVIEEFLEAGMSGLEAGFSCTPKCYRTFWRG